MLTVSSDSLGSPNTIFPGHFDVLYDVSPFVPGTGSLEKDTYQVGAARRSAANDIGRSSRAVLKPKSNI